MALGLLIVGLVVLVLVFDWNWIKGYVAREASKALGRAVVIEGDLDVSYRGHRLSVLITYA